MSEKIEKGWKRVKLGEVANFSQGIQVPVDYQLKKKKPNYVRFIRIVDFTKREADDIRYIKFPGEKYIVSKEDLIMIRYGSQTAGKVVKGVSGAIANNMLKINIFEKVDKVFLYYYLNQNTIFSYLRNSQSSSTMPAITFDMLKNLEIEIPKSIEEQKAIAAVLSSLDDKIDLLHRQNKTLEAMAEALFRKWFIEEAKEDWEEVKLEDVCEIKNGYAFKSNTYQAEGQKIIRTLNFKNGFIELQNLVYISKELAESFDKYYLKRKDFLLVMVGANIGNYAIVTEDILPALQNQNMWCFRAIQADFQLYLNCYLKQLIREKVNITSGSAREFFQKKVFYNFTISIPDSFRLTTFNEIAEEIFNKIENNRAQIRTLEQLRDTLLPKLMSGEVRVKY